MVMASVYPLLSRQLAADRAAARADAATRPRGRSSRSACRWPRAGCVIAPELARLAGGDEFAAAADPLRLLLCAAALAYLSGLLGYALIAGGFERATLWLSLAALVAQPRRSTSRWRRRYGATASAAIALGSEALLLAGGWLLVRQPARPAAGGRPAPGGAASPPP